MNIENESCNLYLGNKKQKAMFIVVSRTCTLVLRDPFFYVPDRMGNLNCEPEKFGAWKEICATL